MARFFFFKKLHCRWSKIPVSYRGGLILAIPAVCIIVILGAWGELRQDAIEVHREIDRSESTLMETNNLLLLLSSAETGIRGYVITNQSDFLKPYERAIADVPNSLKKLENLQRDTPQQQESQKITELVERELDLLSQTLDQAREETTPSEINDLLTRSERASSKIGVAASAIKSEQWQMLSSHRQQLFDVRGTTNLAFWSAVIVSLLSFLAALYLFNLLERELDDRQRRLRSRAEELADLNRVLATTNNTLAERNFELDRFSHIVSHDLKAPLRGISNLSEWIEEDLADKLTEEVRNYLHLQRERITRMENLIDGLLQYARAGKQNAITETVDVGQLLAEVIDSLAPPPSFAIAIDGKMPTITTQRLFLEQIFSNLISNGIKHHHRPDGKITISVREREQFYEFFVADDGPGIAPMAQKKIFEIFNTLGKGDDKLNTGIGLAIVKKIVEERGGKITVESQVGVGTTFRFQWVKSAIA